MTDYMHPGYRKPYPIQTVLRDLAAQEGCDGEPYDAMVFAADWIEEQDRNIKWLRLKVQDMHRRAQRAEGKSLRTAALLETILRSIKLAMKPDAKLSLHSLYGRVRAARDHARANSGRAWVERFIYTRKLEQEVDAPQKEIDALRAHCRRQAG